MSAQFDREKPRPGYYRDADDFLYVTAGGVQYIVQEGAFATRATSARRRRTCSTSPRRWRST